MKVAFYKGRKRRLNRLVSWWLRGPYSHCELVLDTDAWGVSLCISSSFLDGGVRRKRMVLDPAHWDLVDVPGASPEHAYAWFLEHMLEPYDVLGLLGFVWRRQNGERRAWFCSEAVVAMLGWQQGWRFDPQLLFFAVNGNAGLQVPAIN